MMGKDKVPDVVEEQRLRRYGPPVSPRGIVPVKARTMMSAQPILGVDLGSMPSWTITDPPWANDEFKRRFMDEFYRGMQPYQAEIEDNMSGLHRLVRARQLIHRALATPARGARKRKMKRARRLYTVVYGPRHAPARFRMMLAFARASASVRAIAAGIHHVSGLLRVTSPAPLRFGKTLKLEEFAKSLGEPYVPEGWKKRRGD